MIKKIITFMVAIALIVFFLWFENNGIVVSEYSIVNAKIPKVFSGFRILQISDLHNKSFGYNNKKLIEKIKNQKMDIIVITGDLVDSVNYDEAVCERFISDIVELAPVYFVTGNHECGTRAYKDLERFMEEKGVHVLRNKKIELVKDHEIINIMGIDDLNYFSYNYQGNYSFDETLKKLNLSKAEYDKGFKEQSMALSEVNHLSFNILLSHRPQYIDVYAKCGYDLVFSGHAHGGQVRIPFLGGLFAPNQGFFPEYTEGLYRHGETQLVVSRGLGNSRIKQRLFNRPELVMVTLNDR